MNAATDGCEIFDVWKSFRCDCVCINGLTRRDGYRTEFSQSVLDVAHNANVNTKLYYNV